MTINTDAVSGMPDDLNPEIVKATAAFIGQITGLVAPPHDAFPPEWYRYLRTFTARVKEIASENATPAVQAEAVRDEREAFEEFMRANSDPARVDDHIAQDGDSYVEYPTALAWAAWSDRALLSASKPAAPMGWIKGQWGYQTLFNAICDAVTTPGVSVSISVQAFEESMLAASPAAPAQSAEPVGKNALVLSAAQLLEALDFIAPDRATDPEQMEGEVAIEYGEGHSGEAMYCWCAEYPEEGSWVLGGKSVLAAPQPAQTERALTDNERDAARYRWLTKHAYISECHTHEGTVLEVFGTDRRVPRRGSVGGAIDAAMAEEQPAAGGGK